MPQCRIVEDHPGVSADATGERAKRVFAVVRVIDLRAAMQAPIFEAAPAARREGADGRIGGDARYAMPCEQRVGFAGEPGRVPRLKGGAAAIQPAQLGEEIAGRERQARRKLY